MSSREAILGSIRSHLATSVTYDARELPVHQQAEISVPAETISVPLVELFKQSIESVDGHCILAHDETEVVQALTRIIARLQTTKHRARNIAISDAAVVDRLIRLTDLDVDELAIAPDANEVFRFDVGVSTAQAAIADTGTLVLDAARERHRFVSLVPPVHIAIIDAASIFQTLSEALAFIHQGEGIGPTVTFITGPSRTADIELTLAIGVHGPQELFVIVNEGPSLTH